MLPQQANNCQASKGCLSWYAVPYSAEYAGKLLQQVVKPLGGRVGGNARFAQGSVAAELVVREIVHRGLNKA